MKQIVKALLPEAAIAAAREAEKALAARVYAPSHLALVIRDMRDVRRVRTTASRADYEQALLGWLARAQDLGSGGVPGYYALADGWSTDYPETTGYIINTLLEAFAYLGNPDHQRRAERLTEWELEVQLADGSWQSGFVGHPPIPAVFNTGQVIQGVVAAAEHFERDDFMDAARRAGRWLVDVQDADGAWRKHTYREFANTYNTRVAWPLLSLWRATGEIEFRDCAVRYLEWVASRQQDDGWLEGCTLEPEDAPLTHTLAYAAEGLIESGVLLDDTRWVDAGQRIADVLLASQARLGRLAGCYDAGWAADTRFNCLTGHAQMARVWGRLHEIVGASAARTDYLSAMTTAIDYLCALIDLDTRDDALRGGVKGSHPIWGAYMTYRLPNWAAKFMLDALFIERRIGAAAGGPVK